MASVFPIIQRATPTSGGTTTRIKADGEITILLKPSGLLALHTLALGAGDFDGQVCRVISTQVITALTMTVVGTIVGALTGMAANGYGTFEWSSVDTTWYRVA